MTWFQSWRAYRFLKLSCKLGLHLTMEGLWAHRCWCEEKARNPLPVWS